MSGEMIATLGVEVVLAGMILTSSRGLRQDIQQDIAHPCNNIHPPLNSSFVVAGRVVLI